MDKKNRSVFLILTFLFFGIVLVLLLQVMGFVGGNVVAMIFAKGLLAIRERNLLFIVTALMLIVVIPVFVMVFLFAWKYRANNPESKYDPEYNNNHFLEAIWWGVPFVITIFIGAITWIYSDELDPYKPLESEKQPVRIQVVSLQWQWLFIYPEHNIASTNFLQFPVNTPVNFEITSDAPMNSLWIPQLGGQIYAMPAMRTKLHLIADEIGDYRGSSANISGEGFAQMHFIARASSDEDFNKWVKEAQGSSNLLNFEAYQKLAEPSLNNPAKLFALTDQNLFDQIIMKYTMPPPELQEKVK